MKFPDLLKDPADVVSYTMDWTSRLGGARIQSIAISVNGDVQVSDVTAAYPTSVLKFRVSGGSQVGWIGDPQIATLSVVSVAATLNDGQVLSRSFNVQERQL